MGRVDRGQRVAGPDLFAKQLGVIAGRSCDTAIHSHTTKFEELFNHLPPDGFPRPESVPVGLTFDLMYCLLIRTMKYTEAPCAIVD